MITIKTQISNTSKSLVIAVIAIVCCWGNKLQAQQTLLTLDQQQKDFAIFRGGLQEGHTGLYYFIEKKKFEAQCDSVAKTFTANATAESFYLKLRYLLTLLNHGHDRIMLPGTDKVNHKMGILKRDKLYLPLQLVILQNKLYVLADGSDEQTVPKGTEIKRINGVSVKKLMDSMLQYIPADGINQSFKYYNLYNYWYFHFLYNLFYPSTTVFDLDAAGNKWYRIKAKTPAAIDSSYQHNNGRSSSYYNDPMAYQLAISPNTAYLKVGSFYKGFIGRFGHQFQPFIDSAFQDIANRGTKALVIDLRDNEGGGDGYNDYLFAHLSATEFLPMPFDKVPGRKFPLVKYAINLADDVKAFIANPDAFLINDSSLVLKEEYSGAGVPILPKKNVFSGAVYVLTNGGTFSASTAFLLYLYRYRQRTGRPIVFIGEEPGGDVYSNVQCAGQSYIIQLPNSAIIVDMPILCSGELATVYPTKRLPDFEVSNSIQDVLQGRDAVLQFAVDKAKR